jgi:hypothetical protein
MPEDSADGRGGREGRRATWGPGAGAPRACGGCGWEMRAGAMLLAAALALAPRTLAQPAASPPTGLFQEQVLEDFDGQVQGWSESLAAAPGHGKVGRIWVERSDAPTAASLNLAGRPLEMADWDELAFDYYLSAAGLNWWGVKIVDHPLAEGWQATWQITDEQLLTPGRWHTAVINLHQPRWRWGERPDLQAKWISFRAQLAPGAAPVEILVDNLRLRRAGVRLEVTGEEEPRLQEGRLVKSWRLRARNFLPRPVTVRLQATATPPAAVLPGLPRTLSLSAGENAESEQRLEVPADHLSPLGSYRARLQLCAASSEQPLSEVIVAVTAPLGKLPHPLLLLRREEVPQVRAAAERVPRLGKALRDLLSNAEAWLTRALDFPDRGGQWWHWYTCKKCGSPLKTESPTRHVCPACGAVYSGWPYDDVVLAGRHSALAGGARDLALAYLLTGKQAYARRAAEILLGYAARYEQYPLHDIHGQPTGGGRVGPQTLDEATWLIPIVQAFDAVQEVLSPQERTQIVDHLLRPAAKVTWAPNLPIHNISCWRNCAYGLVGLALDDEAMVDAALNGPSGYRQQLQQGVMEPGFWYEGAWGYHFYTLQALLPFVEAALRAGIEVLDPRYRALYEAPLDFLAPDLLLPAFNDSGYENLRNAAPLYAIAYRHWPEPKFAWVANLNPPSSWTALIWGAVELAAGEVRFASGLYPAAGYAVLRTAPWEQTTPALLPPNYLALDFGPHGGGHGHPDKLNFAWWAFGTLLAPDAGSIRYGHPMHGGYYRQTLAHNTLVVDGRSQTPCTGELLFYCAEGNLGLVAASADQAYPGVRFRRLLAVSGPRLFDITLAAAQEPHRYELVYHNRGELSADLPWTSLPQPPEGAGYEWCREWRQAPGRSSVQLNWRVDERVGVVGLHLPQGNEMLLTALGPDQPPTLFIPLLIEQVQGAAAAWVNVLQAYQGAPPHLTARLLPLSAASPAPPAGWALEADDGQYRDVLLVSFAGQPLEAGPYRLRGQAALLHFAAGKLDQVLTTADSAVWVEGKPVK